MIKYKLIIENIQAIEYAEISIGGISGIIGNNNLGKSTVNKILYSLVKAKKGLREVSNKDELFTSLLKNYIEDSHSKTYQKLVDYFDGYLSLDDLTEDEKEIEHDIMLYVEDIAEIEEASAFSSILTEELASPLINRGADCGKIRLFKGNMLIYSVEIYLNNSFMEKVNDLRKFDYNDVTYVEMNDILSLYPVWGDILSSKSIKHSTKDIIKKLMLVNGSNKNTGDSLVYIGNKLNYKTKDEKGNGTLVNINNIGDGYKRLALLRTIIEDKKLFNNNLLLIEEPEVGVHLNKIEDIARMLKGAEEMSTDIVFTTHDSLLVNHLISNIDIYMATSKVESVLDCKTEIKITRNKEEILSPFIEPITKLRREKFKELF